MKIIMDGKTYRVNVRVPSLTESFRIGEGPNADTLLTGEEVRDVVGTYYEHTMEVQPDFQFYQDYLDFYNAISAPVDSHEITMPHEGGTITYNAAVESGSHYIANCADGKRHYRGLSVNFRALAPQREPV